MKAGFSLEILLQGNMIKIKSYCVAWKSFSFLKRKITLPVFDQRRIYKNEMQTFLLCKGVANITFLMNGMDFDSHWNSGGPSVPPHLCFLV